MTMQNNRIASDAVAVTPSDTTQVDFVGLFVGGAGNVAIKGEGGTAVTLTAVPAGTLLMGIHITAVMATNTTATLIVGLKH